MVSGRRHRPSTVFVCAFLFAISTDVDAATLRAARVSLDFLSNGACQVAMHLAVDTAAPVDLNHRLMVAKGTTIDDLIIAGASAGRQRQAGRVLMVPIALRNMRTEYEIRYRIGGGATPVEQCPLLLPDAPTDGISRAVVLDATIPSRSRRMREQFPAFAWESNRGRVTLGHLPAFVRVRYADDSVLPGWRETLDMQRTVDVAALVILCAATVLWMTIYRKHA
jgi:hypothetical protein